MLDIAIIIRTKNESRWINFCLSSISRQDFSNFKVVIVDNSSTDATLDICDSFDCKVVEYKPKNSIYKPGEALNIGIKSLDAKAYVFLSAHCIPKTEKWLSNLWQDLYSDEDFAGVYGRQIPMAYSSDQVKRDLTLIFSSDSRIQTSDPFFHNANSIIKGEYLKPDLFSEELSNIEDRAWAAKIISNNGKLFYSARSDVFHYHGLNHSDDKRLSKTTRIIEEISQSYNESNVNKDSKKIGFDYFLSIRHQKDLNNYQFQVKQIKYTILNLISNKKFISNRDRILISIPKEIYSIMNEIKKDIKKDFNSEISIKIIKKDLWLSQKWVSIADVIIDSFKEKIINIKENKYICYLDHSYLLRNFNQLDNAVEYLIENQDTSSIIFHNSIVTPLISIDNETQPFITEQLLAPLKVRSNQITNDVQIITGYGTFFNKKLLSSGEIIGKKSHHIKISNSLFSIPIRDYDTLNLLLKLSNIDL